MVVTEGRPDETGLTMARQLEELKVPITMVLDSGVSYALEVLRSAVAVAVSVGPEADSMCTSW